MSDARGSPRSARSALAEHRGSVMKARFVGVISDTHGLIRPTALEALAGAELILHAGDIGKPEVLDALRNIAPVVAIRGNVDRGPWAAELPEARSVEVFGERGYLIHDLKSLTQQIPDKPALIVHGHSHQPGCQRRDGVLYLNPGSAGPRRFKLPVCVARLRFLDGGLHGEIVELLP